jgi:hypothetical protein
LLTRTDLAPHLTAFGCQGYIWEDEEHDDRGSEPALVEKCTAHVIRMSGPAGVTGHIIGNLACGRRAAYTAVILHLLPNLEKLSIFLGQPRERPVVSSHDGPVRILYGLGLDRCTLNDLAGIRGGLQHLKFLCAPITHFDLLRFLYLPNLESLHLKLTDEDGYGLGAGSRDRPMMPIASRNGVEHLLR